MSMISKTLSSHNWWSNNIFHRSSCNISYINFLIIISQNIDFTSFVKIISWWNSCFLIFIKTFQNSFNLLINLVNIIDSVSFNCLVRIIKSRSCSWLSVGIKSWAFHFWLFIRVVTIKQRLFHLFYSFEKLFLIFICIKFVGG